MGIVGLTSPSLIPHKPVFVQGLVEETTRTGEISFEHLQGNSLCAQMGIYVLSSEILGRLAAGCISAANIHIMHGYCRHYPP